MHKEEVLKEHAKHQRYINKKNEEMKGLLEEVTYLDVRMYVYNISQILYYYVPFLK